MLHPERGGVDHPEALDDTVVQVHVREFDACRVGERVGDDRVVVVLAGDLDPAGGLVAHRVVAAVVTEAELVGVGAEREAEDLVPEADPEHRHLARPIRVPASTAPTTAAGSPGPFERNTPSGSRARTSLAGRRRRNDLDSTTGRKKVPQDGALDAEVVGDDAERRVVGAGDVRLGAW